MRTETLWQGERREARLHWWHEVLDAPVPGSGANGEQVFDEVLCLRFRAVPEMEAAGRGDDRQLRLVCRS